MPPKASKTVSRASESAQEPPRCQHTDGVVRKVPCTNLVFHRRLSVDVWGTFEFLHAIDAGTPTVCYQGVSVSPPIMHESLASPRGKGVQEEDKQSEQLNQDQGEYLRAEPSKRA